MKSFIAAAATAALSTGCASFVNDVVHPIKVETRNAAGDFVADARCTLSNDYTVVTLKSGDSALVRRSAKDLDIVCVHPGEPDATGRAVSRASAGMLGNILIGGGVGAIIDHSRDTGYMYPTWVQLVFGQSLVFDRSAQKDGAPLAGVAAAASASASKPANATATAASAPRS